MGTFQATPRRQSDALMEVPGSEKEFEDATSLPGLSVASDPVANLREPLGCFEPTAQSHLIDEQVEAAGGPPPKRHDFTLDGPKGDEFVGFEAGSKSLAGERGA